MLISTFPKRISEMKLKRRKKKNKVDMGVSLGLKRADKAVKRKNNFNGLASIIVEFVNTPSGGTLKAADLIFPL